MRRMAFFFSMRRTSLLETNQRLLRSWLSRPLRITFFLKRLKSCSCDSLGRKLTDVMKFTSSRDAVSGEVGEKSAEQKSDARPASTILLPTRANASLPGVGAFVKLRICGEFRRLTVGEAR